LYPPSASHSRRAGRTRYCARESFRLCACLLSVGLCLCPSTTSSGAESTRSKEANPPRASRLIASPQTRRATAGLQPDRPNDPRQVPCRILLQIGAVIVHTVGGRAPGGHSDRQSTARGVNILCRRARVGCTAHHATDWPLTTTQRSDRSRSTYDERHIASLIKPKHATQQILRGRPMLQSNIQRPRPVN
jgi:hypothetical protein